ncbi:MAG: hypothetical protein ABI885_15320, partial [Gammaproteobacteria bacterium]
MAHLETFSTAGPEARRKIEFLNESTFASIAPLLCESSDLHAFNGHISRTRVGELTVAEVIANAQTKLHTRAHAARNRRSLFFIHLQ